MTAHPTVRRFLLSADLALGASRSAGRARAMRERTYPLASSGRNRLEFPLRILTEEPARVVVEDLGCFALAVPAAEELQARVRQHARRAFAPVAGRVDADH